MTAARRDVFELLAAADPAAQARHPGLDPASARGRAILDRALSTPPQADVVSIDEVRAEREARLRRAVLAAAVALAVLGAAAAAWVHSRRPTHTLSVGCYAEARVDAATFVIQAPDGGAVSACADLWRQGVFGADRTQPPPLAACVLPSGPVGVFPGAAACAELGLDPAESPTAQQQRQSAKVAALTNRLQEASGPGCLTPGDGRALVLRLYDELGLAGWTVVDPPGGFPAERPCASFSVDEPSRRVILVPLARR